MVPADSFREDLIAGLAQPQKQLPPKYFYDAAGSRLFDRICRLPEYYPTRTELAITRANLASIARFAGAGCELIEYGSGASRKTRLLIRALRPAVYVPVDISEAALAGAAQRLSREFRWLHIFAVAGDFTQPRQGGALGPGLRQIELPLQADGGGDRLADQFVQRLHADRGQHVGDLVVAWPDVPHDEFAVVLELIERSGGGSGQVSVHRGRSWQGRALRLV